MTTIGDLSDDQLADEITTWAGRIAAGEAHLLALIAEFDRREAWGGHGLLSCAHWLSWRIGLGLRAARERVRVARALESLPRTSAAFHSGQVSWSQVRAITRVATADDEETYVGLAKHSTAAQLERIVRGVRRVHRIAEAEADPELAAHRLRSTMRYDEDGTFVLTVRGRADDAAILQAAFEAVRADLDRARGDEAAEAATAAPAAPSAAPLPECSAAHPESVAEQCSAEHPPAPTDAAVRGGATVADALLAMARLALEDQARRQPTAARRTRALLTAQVDPLSGWARLADGELMPPGSLPGSLHRQLRSLPGRGGAPEPVRLRPVLAEDLAGADLGRDQRDANQALRDLLATIDGHRCRFPGCTRRRKLHAHHVRYWSDGGGTDLRNLVLVCARHHTLIHQQGFALTLHPDRRLDVATADVPVLHHPGLPWGDAGLLPSDAVDAASLPPTSVEARMDLAYVVSVVLQQAA